jgi:hypothetical protein
MPLPVDPLAPQWGLAGTDRVSLERRRKVGEWRQAYAQELQPRRRRDRSRRSVRQLQQSRRPWAGTIGGSA